MKVYHLLLLVWVFFVMMWVLNSVSSAHRRREAERRKLGRG